MREKIQDGMLEKLRRRQTLGKTPVALQLRWAFQLLMRGLTSRWLIDVNQYMQKNPAIIENGWKKFGIADALANGAPSDDPFVPI